MIPAFEHIVENQPGPRPNLDGIGVDTTRILGRVGNIVVDFHRTRPAIEP